MPNRVSGVDELIAQLEKLSFRQGEQVLAKAVRPGAQLVADEEERRAPRRTGRLGASIRVMVTERSATSVIARIGPTRRAFYASFHNWGTRHQIGSHFVEEAVDAVMGQAYAMIRQHLGTAIDKALRKHG